MSYVPGSSFNNLAAKWESETERLWRCPRCDYKVRTALPQQKPCPNHPYDELEQA